MNIGSYDEHQTYCERVSSEDSDLLRDLERLTYVKHIHPRMISGRYLGRTLSMISKMIRPERILEIGTYTGYSALCLAEGLPEGGELITIERNDELQSIQKAHFSRSQFASQIKCITGNALDLLPELQDNFDLIFLDADKENYSLYLPLILDLSQVGTHILIDNMLWEGKVLDEEIQDVQTKSIRDLTQSIADDSRLEQVLLPVRDGLMIVRVDSL